MDIVQIQMAALHVNAIWDMLEMGSRVSVNLCVQNVYSEDCIQLQWLSSNKNLYSCKYIKTFKAIS
jgi:hypothetical protein